MTGLLTFNRASRELTDGKRAVILPEAEAQIWNILARNHGQWFGEHALAHIVGITPDILRQHAGNLRRRCKHFDCFVAARTHNDFKEYRLFIDAVSHPLSCVDEAAAPPSKTRSETRDQREASPR